MSDENLTAAKRLTLNEIYGAVVPDHAVKIINFGRHVAGLHAVAQAAIQADPVRKLICPALVDVAVERERQKRVEGWTPEHDDGHNTGDIALAAAAYARHAAQSEDRRQIDSGYQPEDLWPSEWKWRPSTRRRDLIKAGALILAEIERLDRAALAETKEGE